MVEIKLYAIFHTSTLRHRESARKVVELVNKEKSSIATIDFSNIDFASRSFLHELLTDLDCKNPAFVNTSQEVKQMMSLVQKSITPIAC